MYLNWNIVTLCACACFCYIVIQNWTTDASFILLLAADNQSGVNSQYVFGTIQLLLLLFRNGRSNFEGVFLVYSISNKMTHKEKKELSELTLFQSLLLLLLFGTRKFLATIFLFLFWGGGGGVDFGQLRDFVVRVMFVVA